MLDIYRIERKYPVPLTQAAGIEGRVRLFAKPDPHNGPWGYSVRSVYFDTPSNRDHLDKENGEFRRQKLRLRTYGGERAKLELKEKLGECQRKRSLELTRLQAEALLRGGNGLLAKCGDPFALELYGLMESQVYRPKALVCYRRRAYYLEENSTRITFDDCLWTDLDVENLFSGLPALPVSGGGWLTMEVKFRDFLPANLKLALGEGVLPQASIGKYSLCRRALPG